MVFKIFLIIFCLFLPFVVYGSVVINEIAWMGTKIEGVESKNWWRYEWIELLNATNKEIDISNWQIKNAKSKNETLTISAGKIPANSYFLICQKETNNCDLIESKLSLHNEYNKNGKLVLKDTAGSIIDTIPEANDKQWPAGDNKTKQTMERTDSGNWQTSQEPNGTPGAENSIREKLPTQSKPESEPQPQPEPEPEPKLEEKTTSINYATGIIFNEILPSPEGPDAKNEWTVPSNEHFLCL